MACTVFLQDKPSSFTSHNPQFIVSVLYILQPTISHVTMVSQQGSHIFLGHIPYYMGITKVIATSNVPWYPARPCHPFCLLSTDPQTLFENPDWPKKYNLISHQSSHIFPGHIPDCMAILKVLSTLKMIQYLTGSQQKCLDTRMCCHSRKLRKQISCVILYLALSLWMAIKL